MPIQTLLPSNIINVAPNKEGNGCDAETVIATAEHPLLGERQVYIKFYNDAIAPRGLINEMAGYMLAEHLKFKVPSFGGLIVVERSQVPNISAHPDTNQLVGWYSTCSAAPSMKQSLGWVNGISDILARNIQNDARSILSRSPKTTQAIIALDMLMANVDRNLGNILMTPNAPTLIDHGRIATGNSWRMGVAPFDDPTSDTINIIGALMDEEMQKLPYRHAVLVNYERMSDIISADIESISHQLVDAFGHEDAEQLLWYIHNRSTTLNAVKALKLAL